MKTLIIGVGNPLRGDDGVAQRVLESLPVGDQIMRLAVLGLTPELAPDIARHDTVMIVDADCSATVAVLRELTDDLPASCCGPFVSFTHVLTPEGLVDIARRFYGFCGEALVCHIPARAFETPRRLSAVATSGAREAAHLVMSHLISTSRSA